MYISKILGNIGGLLMKKISTLGPKGTFSELAARKYIEKIKIPAEIAFYPTMSKAFNAVGKECEIGVIPIENTLDGYVQLCLDLLSQGNLQIAYELKIPIQFAFIGNACHISDITKVYSQFKTQGQCHRFLEALDNARIVTTDSNSESFEQLKTAEPGTGAVIPQHMLNYDNRFPLVINNVTDCQENETRFLVLSKCPELYDKAKHYKTSIAIMNVVDEPGALFKILNEFSSKEINLNSIMSRPTKKALGKYLFFIDIDGHYPMEERVKEVIDRISEKNIVKILGSYSQL
jgi:prephenate dehydratase